MKLYYSPGACSLSDHIVLEWTGAPYEAVRVSREERQTPAFRKLNPAGAVPVFEQDGWVLTQNAAILNYLADKFQQAKLGGDDFHLSMPLRVPTMGGALLINRLVLNDFGTEGASGVLDAELEPIELGQLTGAFGWPAFSGSLAGAGNGSINGYEWKITQIADTRRKAKCGTPGAPGANE